MRILFAATLMASFVGTTWAQGTAPTPSALETKLDQAFRRADRNGDGAIDAAEASAAQLWFQDDINGVDGDGSGTVTIFEFVDALRARLSHSMSDFDAADTNHDGTLSKEELAQSRRLTDLLKPAKRGKSPAGSRPETESPSLDRMTRDGDLPSVAPNIVDKRF